MNHPIALYLGCAVPLEIAALESAGGPDADDYAAAQAFGRELAARGDVLLYGGKPGEAADLANRTARAVAVLAFSPGGVTLFGEHWEAEARPVGAYYTPQRIGRSSTRAWAAVRS